MFLVAVTSVLVPLAKNLIHAPCFLSLAFVVIVRTQMPDLGELSSGFPVELTKVKFISH